MWAKKATKKKGEVVGKSISKKTKTAKKNTKSNKPSYNWVALKKSFFEHEWSSVSLRYREEFGKKKGSKKPNRYFSQKAKWRAEEKKKRQEEQLENAKKKLDQNFTISTEKLKKSKDMILTIVHNRLNKHVTKEKENKLSTRDLETLIKIIKTELWEPTTVTKNENQNIHDISKLDQSKLYDD